MYLAGEATGGTHDRPNLTSNLNCKLPLEDDKAQVKTFICCIELTGVSNTFELCPTAVQTSAGDGRKKHTYQCFGGENLQQIDDRRH
jgi:hypothetical protein